jgi:hypothetical protein
MPKHDCLSPRRTGRVSWLRQTSCCDVCDTTTRTAGRFQRPLALVQSQPAGGEDIVLYVCARPVMHLICRTSGAGESSIRHRC